MLQQAIRLMQPIIRPKRSTIGSLKLPNTDRLPLMQDFLHTYRVGSFVEPALSCRVRIYMPHPRHPQPVIVLYSAMTPGSITTWAEDVVTPIWQRLNRPNHVHFVEHWFPNSWNMSEFMLVQFEAQRGRLINPRWAELRRSEIEAVIHGSIEVLDG